MSCSEHVMSWSLMLEEEKALQEAEKRWKNKGSDVSDAKKVEEK